MVRPVYGILVFGLGLIAATFATAQDLVIPDRARLQTMSQEEYAAYREQIQNRMESMGDSSGNSRSQMETPTAAGGYGQGYGSRRLQGGGYGRGGGRHR